MHPIWSGVIGFGLVNIPVSLYSPAKEETLDLDFLHAKDRSPVRYARFCREEDKEIAWKDIVRGYKTPRGYVVLKDEDFAKADARKTKAIDILHFARAEEIDPMYFEKPYYLEPDAKAKKAYLLLCEALRETRTVGVATFVLRSRENLAILMPHDDVLVLNQLRFAHEVESPRDLDLPTAHDVAIPPKELKIAIDLVKKSTEKFRPGAHRDRYLKALQTVIKAKSHGLKVKRNGTPPKATHADDLMAALERSLRTRKKTAAR
jgi:DNA end-binding protein Ku